MAWTSLPTLIGSWSEFDDPGSMKCFPCLLLLLACTTPEVADVVISNVSVVDVVNGKTLPHQDVFVNHNRIMHIGSHGQAHIRAEKIIKGDDKFLMPGLWDMHVHIHEYTDLFLPLFLAHGITGIRDLGNIHINNFHDWKRYVETLEFAPRLGPVAAKIVDGEDFWAKPIVVSDTSEAREAVKKVHEIGGDYVKIYGSLTPALVKALVNEAQAQGLPFAGHYVWGMDLADLSDLGFRSIEHLEISLSYAQNSEELLEKYAEFVNQGTVGDHVFEFFADLNRAHRNKDPQKMSRLFSKLKKNQTWQCTAVLALLWVEAQDYTQITEEDLGLQYYPDSLRLKYWDNGMNNSAEAKAFAQESLEVSMEILKDLFDAKVPILAGGHPTPLRALPPGISLHKELELMQASGLPTKHVIKTATINAAKYLDRTHELGSVGVGKFADLVLLEADPLQDIRNTRLIHGVMKDGFYYDRSAIDSVLQVLPK